MVASAHLLITRCVSMLRRRRAMRTLMPRVAPVAPVMATTMRRRRVLEALGVGWVADCISASGDSRIECSVMVPFLLVLPEVVEFSVVDRSAAQILMLLRVRVIVTNPCANPLRDPLCCERWNRVSYSDRRLCFLYVIRLSSHCEWRIPVIPENVDASETPRSRGPDPEPGYRALLILAAAYRILTC